MKLKRVTIEKMGQLGEGLFRDEDGPVFVPLSLPGEIIDIANEAPRSRLVEIIEPSAERVPSFCPYFGSCGGCALQHWHELAYRAWKRELVVTALSFVGLSPPVAALIDAHGRGRRRVKFHIRFVDGKPLAGFMTAKTHQIVDIDHCPILVPELAEAANMARALAKPLMKLRKPLSVQFTSTRTGLDVDISGAGKIDFGMRLSLGELAGSLNLARLSIHGDIVLERHAPMLRFGKVDIVLPAGAFTQATEAGEEVLATLVLEATKGAKKIADLFSGLGPFALRLVTSASLYAADSEAASLGALKRGYNLVQGLKPLQTEIRDLFRRPLLRSELKGFDAVIFDPPRAGAEAQARELAASTVPKIIAVSCNVASFSRDAAILVEGGYKLLSVTPVDQFKWSAHVEIVAVFER